MPSQKSFTTKKKLDLIRKTDRFRFNKEFDPVHKPRKRRRFVSRVLGEKVDRKGEKRGDRRRRIGLPDSVWFGGSGRTGKKKASFRSIDD